MKKIDIMKMKTYKGFSEKQIRGLEKCAKKQIDIIERKLDKQKTPTIRKVEKFVNAWMNKRKMHYTDAEKRMEINAITRKYGKDAFDEFHNFNQKMARENAISLELRTGLVAMKMQALRNKCENN